jgi:hypothetical protein
MRRGPVSTAKTGLPAASVQVLVVRSLTGKSVWEGKAQTSPAG